MGFEATLEVAEPLTDAGLLAERNVLDMVGHILPTQTYHWKMLHSPPPG